MENNLFNNASTVSVEDGTLQPVEGIEQEKGEIIRSMSDRDFLRQLEEAAELAPRTQKAMNKILVSFSLPEDWIDFDGTACLSSAGAERFFKQFPFVFSDWQKPEKIEWQDEIGKAYRYIYRAQAHLWGRSVMCEGSYSTRDKFLGKKGDEYRDILDINENHIGAAARHICIGNGVKTLLGLRGMRSEYLRTIIAELGGNPAIIKSVSFDIGGQGGTATDDRELQVEIGKWLREMHDNAMELMKAHLIAASKFKGKDGKEKSCDSIAKLKGKWLKIVHVTIKKDYEEWDKLTTPKENSDDMSY